MNHSRAILSLVTISVLAGCGASTGASSSALSSNASLGRRIATAPFAAAATTSSAPGVRSRSAASSTGPEHIHLPATPQTTSTARAIRSVGARFAQAYLAYQIGHDQPAVIAAIRATCTAGFARFLLAKPASVPPAQRNSPAFAPASLTSVRYTGEASFGPTGSLHIALATYQTTRAPTVRGALIIELQRPGRRWLVSGVRPQ